jgi:secondary thiamine-phosphate synthase enzyme
LQTAAALRKESSVGFAGTSGAAVLTGPLGIADSMQRGIPQAASVSFTLLGESEKPVMKFHTEYLTFNTKKHREYVHITPQVEKIVHASGVTNGLALVSAMHITAGVYVNDDERGLIQDIDKWLEQLAPFREDYLHHQTGEDNGDSHLKAILVHHQVIVPVTNGKLLLGTWQRVFYAEFDGQRSKRVVVVVMGE